MKKVNCEKIAFIPIVNISVFDVKPPSLLLNNRRNMVDATLSAKVAIVRVV
jgi:hypothetical protein